MKETSKVSLSELPKAVEKIDVWPLLYFMNGENGGFICWHQSSQNHCAGCAFVILTLWEILGTLITSGSPSLP